MSNWIDLVDNGSPPAVGGASTSRIARVNGLLQESRDGGPFQVIPSLPVPLGVLDYYKQQAIARLGLGDPSLRLIWSSDFGADGNIQTAALGGAAAPAQGIRAPGGIQINPAAGAAGEGGRVGAANSTQVGFIADMTNRRHYWVSIFKLNVAPNNHTRIYTYFGVAPNSAIRTAGGINGVTQTEKFAFSVGVNDASTVAPILNVLSTVSPLVGPWFTMECWYDGESVFGSVNGETPVLVGNGQHVFDPSSLGSSFYFESQPSASGQADSPIADFMALWVEA